MKPEVEPNPSKLKSRRPSRLVLIVARDRDGNLSETMRSNILTGDTPFRRAYIRSVIDQVEVDDEEIRI